MSVAKFFFRPDDFRYGGIDANTPEAHFMTTKKSSSKIDPSRSVEFKAHDGTRVTVKDFRALTQLKRKKAQNVVFLECVILDYIEYQKGCRRDISLGGIRDWWISTYPDKEITDFEKLLVAVLKEKAEIKRERRKRRTSPFEL